MRPDSESSVRLAILSLFRLENPVLKGPELCFNPATYKPIPVVLGLWSSSMKPALQLGISFLNVESFPHSSSISRDFLVFIWRIFSVSAASFGQPPKEQTFFLRGCARPSDNLNKHVDLQLKMIFHFKFFSFWWRTAITLLSGFNFDGQDRQIEKERGSFHLVSLSSLLAEWMDFFQSRNYL